MANPERDTLTGLPYEELWAFAKSRQGDVAARRNYYAGLGDIVTKLYQVPHLRDKISPDDLDDAFIEALATIKEPLGRAGKIDIERILHKRLGWERDYDFYFYLGGVSGFQSGFQFGYGELRPLSKLPRRDQRYVIGGFFGRPKGATYKRQSQVNANAHWFLCIRQRTVGWHNAVERAEMLANRSLTAYELVTGLSELTQMGIASTPRLSFVIVCDDSKLSGRYRAPGFGPPIVSMSGFDELMIRMTELLRKENRSELEERIVSIVDVFVMIQNETPPELKFLLKVICLEALFLSQDDRDYLGQRIAEKVAFSLGDNKVWIAFAFGVLPHLGFIGNFPPNLVDDEFVKTKKSESRRRLHKEVARLYGKRSAIVHQGTMSEKSRVTPQDYAMVSILLRLSLTKMLALAEEGITHLKKRSSDDSSSFDQLIEKLKY
jgi:hypothetical protein